MLYVVGRKDGTGRIYLIKVSEEKDFGERFTLKENEVKLGTFTTSELNVLQSSEFAVVSSGA